MQDSQKIVVGRDLEGVKVTQGLFIWRSVVLCWSVLFLKICCQALIWEVLSLLPKPNIGPPAFTRALLCRLVSGRQVKNSQHLSLGRSWLVPVSPGLQSLLLSTRVSQLCSGQLWSQKIHHSGCKENQFSALPFRQAVKCYSLTENCSQKIPSLMVLLGYLVLRSPWQPC